MYIALVQAYRRDTDVTKKNNTRPFQNINVLITGYVQNDDIT